MYISKKYVMKLGVCVGVKLSNKYLNEWVENYRSLGFDTIIILDNNEIDGERPQDVLGTGPDLVFVDKRGDHTFKRQVIYYTQVYNDFKDKLDYILFCDDDELLSLNPRFKDAKDWIGSFDTADVDCICINWRMFGDNGHLRYYDAPVRERFPEPLPLELYAGYSFSQNRHLKTMVHCQGKPLAFSHPHFCLDTRGIPLKSVNASGKPIKPGWPFCDYDYECASLDHYQTKSTEEFCDRRLGNKRIAGKVHFDGGIIDIRKEIRQYFAYNGYSQEKMDYISAFLRDNNIPFDPSEPVEKVLVLSHEANRTGAPVALLNKMKAAPAYRSFSTILLNDGPCRSDFEALGQVKLADYKSPFIQKALRSLAPKFYQHVRTYNIRHSLPERIIRRFFPDMYQTPVQRLADKGCCDIIYANTVVCLDPGIELKQKLGVPLIAHINEADIMLQTYGATSGKFEECDAIVACSEYVKRILVKSYSVPEDKIIVQYPVSQNAMTFLYGGNQGRRIDDSCYNIAVTGTDIWRKGLFILPAVIRRFKQKYPDIPVRFVSFGDYMPLDKIKLVHDLTAAGCLDNVVFKDGSRYASEINECDTLLLLSKEDPFPLVAIENALLSHPVVLFEDACGTSEWLQGSCFEVPFLDIDSIVDALAEARSDATIGQAARRIALSKLNEAIKKQEILPVIHGIYIK